MVGKRYGRVDPVMYQSECLHASCEADNVVATYMFVSIVARRNVITSLQLSMKRGAGDNRRLEIRRIRAGHRGGKESLWDRFTRWAQKDAVCSKESR